MLGRLLARQDWRVEIEDDFLEVSSQKGIAAQAAITVRRRTCLVAKRGNGATAMRGMAPNAPAVTPQMPCHLALSRTTAFPGTVDRRDA